MRAFAILASIFAATVGSTSGNISKEVVVHKYIQRNENKHEYVGNYLFVDTYWSSTGSGVAVVILR